MKILEIDNKNQEVIVKIETLNDLWTLYNIISRDDYVSTRTSRRVVLREGTKGERKNMWIKLKVESISFHEFSNRLRIKGTISEGPEDFVSFGTYHTFNVEVGNTLNIIKDKWLRSEIKRLKESSKFEANFLIIITAIETGLANLALITNFSHTKIATIKRTIPGKRYEQIHRNKAYEDFFNDIYNVLEENIKNMNINLIIFCGPGNSKDRFLNYLKEKKQPNFLSKISIIHASSGTESAIFEILKSPQLKELKEKVKILQETEKIENIFNILATNPDLIAIGIKEIATLSKSGIIDELFVADILLRGTSKEKKNELEGVLTDVENSGGKYYILSSEQPTGQQIIDLGDIVAILRYKP
ncbi:MAG: mRNA surveillance protein pelota [Promethearchaeota archaeon]